MYYHIFQGHVPGEQDILSILLKKWFYIINN